MKTRLLNQLYLEFNDKQLATNIDMYVMPFGAHCCTIVLVFDLRKRHVTFIDLDSKLGPAILANKINHMILNFLNLIRELHTILDVKPTIPMFMGSCEMDIANVVASSTRADSTFLVLRHI